MFRKLIAIHQKKTGAGPEAREKMARLEKAEQELDSLKTRAANAISTLDSRKRDNHWRESIQNLIQGA